MKPLISIVVPVYNSGNYLAPCIDSLLAQTYRPLEIILVDDASTDGSRDVCQRYVRQYGSLIRMIDGPGDGANSGRWAGIENSKGDFVICCDSDDLTHPQLLEMLFHAVCVSGLPVACCPHDDFFDGQTPENLPYDKKHEVKAFQTFDAIDALLHSKAFDWGLWNKLYMRPVLTQEAFHNGVTYNEDLLTNFLLFKQVAGVALVNQVGYHYRQHTGSISRKPLSEKMLSDQLSVAQTICNGCLNTPVSESALAFSFEKQLYLLSLIYRSPSEKQFEVLANQYRQDILQQYPLCKRSRHLPGNIRKAAFLCVYFPSIYRFLCRHLLEKR